MHEPLQGTLRKIVSGGQTGVDRAALDAAIALGIPAGGWCPAGRRAEDGAISPHYPLVETPSRDYAQRTAWNVRDSDATLVLAFEEPGGGTALTIAEARQRSKPILVFLLPYTDPGEVGNWMARHHVAVLNVAGPREGEAPGIYRRARAFLEAVFRQEGLHRSFE